MRDILISRKRWKTVRVGGVGARQLGGGRRARFSSAPKRGGTSEEGAEGGRDEGRGGRASQTNKYAIFQRMGNESLLRGLLAGDCETEF